VRRAVAAAAEVWRGRLQCADRRAAPESTRGRVAQRCHLLRPNVLRVSFFKKNAHSQIVAHDLFVSTSVLRLFVFNETQMGEKGLRAETPRRKTTRFCSDCLFGVCVDRYAEPRDLYAQPDVGLFRKVRLGLRDLPRNSHFKDLCISLPMLSEPGR